MKPQRKEIAMNLSEPISGTIRNPDADQHFMVIHRLKGTATAKIGESVLVESDDVLVIRETGKTEYPPKLYFAESDIAIDRLKKIDRRTFCPIKGEATYFDVMGADTSAPAAAWKYDSTLDFDEDIKLLRGRVSFDTKLVQLVVTDE